MVKKMFVLTFRKIKQQKINFLITLTGLATGLAVAFFCYLFVIHEFRYDLYHKKANRLYRMITKNKNGGDFNAATPYPLKDVLLEEFPEIQSVVQLSKNWRSCFIKLDDQIIKEEPQYYSEPELFKIFDIPLSQGNHETCLNESNSVIISKMIANKYFPDQNPIDQSLNIKINEQFENFKVTGVLAPTSQNSFFKPDILLLIDVITPPDMVKGWTGASPQTFFLFKENISVENFISKLPPFSEKCIEKGFFGYFEIQSLKKMHLNSSQIWGTIGDIGSMNYIYLYASIGLLILLIGCINFVNLSTAQSIKRATEIGIRKVIGAGKSHIRRQFLAESLFITLLALPIAIGLLELFLPYGNQILNRNMQISYLHNWVFLFGIIILTFVVGIISGSYNAFYISRFEPMDIFKSKIQVHSTKSRLRTLLLSFQFIIFCSLIICSLLMYRQMNFIQNKQLGYNKEQLLSLYLPTTKKDTRIETFKNEIKKLAGVKNITISSFTPPSIGNWMGSNLPDPKNKDKSLDINFIISDLDYFDTVELNVKYGRFYSENQEDFSNRRLVLNDAAIKMLEIESPIGKHINMWGGDWEIIGVIDDFHTHSMYNKIGSLFFMSTNQLDEWSMQYLNNYAIRVKPGFISETLSNIEKLWRQFFPDEYFDYRFTDQEFDRIHRSDRQLSYLIFIFTITSIVLSCMGLFGVISFTTQNRTKEIGIRKVLGASIPQILGLITKEIMIIFIISITIAIPISTYFIHKWLQKFAYQTNIDFTSYMFASFLAILVIAITVSWQTIRAAIANPVESIRYE